METIEVTSKRYVCRHIHTTGNRCGSPALTGEEFCYYHHATRRGPRPADHDYLCPNSTFDLPSLEDRPSIQLAVAVVARRIALNQIDLKRGRLLLYALRIASTNLPREPRNAERKEEIEQVDEIQLDPIHGPLAPVAEVIIEESRKGRMDRFFEELSRRRPCPVCKTEETEAAPVEAILPEIQAVAARHRVPHVRRTAPTMGFLPSRSNPRSRPNPFVLEILHKQHQPKASRSSQLTTVLQASTSTRPYRFSTYSSRIT